MESSYLQFIIRYGRGDALTMDVIANSTCFKKLKDHWVGHGRMISAPMSSDIQQESIEPSTLSRYLTAPTHPLIPIHSPVLEKYIYIYLYHLSG